jgi:hypothetical protein
MMFALSRRRPCTSLRTLLPCRQNHGWDRSTPDYDEKSSTPTDESELPRNSIHIKSWDMIGSLAEAYAIIRAIEHRYGRLREYRFWRVSRFFLPRVYVARNEKLDALAIGFRTTPAFAESDNRHLPITRVVREGASRRGGASHPCTASRSRPRRRPRPGRPSGLVRTSRRGRNNGSSGVGKRHDQSSSVRTG